MNGRSDAALVVAARNGDDAAYGTLVERYQAAYVRYATRMLSSRPLAEDVVQDGFVTAYERLESCEHPERFAAWCFRIVRNRCHDELRGPESRNEGSAPLRTMPSSGPGPGRSVERAELRRDIGAALRDMSPLLREAFVLFHEESLTYPEMSERLGASESALKMRVKRARDELQAALAQWEDHVPT